jgi:hypothetical protein
MTRTKHTTRQTILDNNVSNARERLAKVARNRIIVRENRSIRKTRSLLKETKRKARRFKSESTNSVYTFLVIFLLIKCVAVALREIRKYQKSVDLLMSKLLMRRLMKELTLEFKNDIKFQVAAANALHETVEVMLINYFESR